MPFSSKTDSRYSVKLYRNISSHLMGSLYAGFTHESYCLKLDKTTIPSDIWGRVFWDAEKSKTCLHFQPFRFILIPQLWILLFYFHRLSSLKTVIFQQIRWKPAKLKNLFAIIWCWNISGRIVYFTSCRTLACMMIAGSWRGHQRSAWKRSVLFYECLSSTLDFVWMCWWRKEAIDSCISFEIHNSYYSFPICFPEKHIPVVLL